MTMKCASKPREGRVCRRENRLNPKRTTSLGSSQPRSAQSARQLSSRDLTGSVGRVLNGSGGKKNFLELFRRAKKFVLVCRSDPADRYFLKIQRNHQQRLLVFPAGNKNFLLLRIVGR